jgi:hypothetical protein
MLDIDSAMILLTLLVFGAVAPAFIVWRRVADATADARADRLARELLTPAEYAQLVERGYLEVRSRTRPGRVYRIPADPGLVAVRDGDAPPVYLCLQPLERLPSRDIVLLHKLMIEGAEAEYWRKANVLTLQRPRQQYRGDQPPLLWRH